MKRLLALLLLACIILSGCNYEPDANASPAEIEDTRVMATEVPKQVKQWWTDVISESLAREIEAAAEEVNLFKAENIKNIELEKTKETDLFTRRVYKINNKI